MKTHIWSLEVWENTVITLITPDQWRQQNLYEKDKMLIYIKIDIEKWIAPETNLLISKKWLRQSPLKYKHFPNYLLATLTGCFRVGIYSYLSRNLRSLSGSRRFGGQELLYSWRSRSFCWFIIRCEPRAPTTGEVRRVRREAREEEGASRRPPDGHQMNKLWWPPLGVMGSNARRPAADSSISPQRSPIRWLLIMNEKLSASATPPHTRTAVGRGLGVRCDGGEDLRGICERS